MTVEQLRRTLLVHCSTEQALRCADVVDRPGTGLVVSPRRHDESGLLATVTYLLRRRRFGNPVLLDAARYAGDARLPASAPFNPRWLRRQRELGLPVLTDSGYVEDGDEAGLVSILHRAAVQADTIAVLPLHPLWLRDRIHLTALTGHLRSTGVPVALVLEARRDPFSQPGVVAGLLEVLDCGVPTMLLRCDVSALGALCSGALAAAVGTVPGLRHLAPRRPLRGPPVPRPAATVFRPTLSYRRVNVIARAKRQHPDPHLWACPCPVCGGRDVDWMAELPEGTAEVAAFEHSIRVLSDLRDELLADPVPLTRSRRSWAARCADAMYREKELGWPASPMLRHWAASGPVTMPSQRRASSAPWRPVAQSHDL